jgi:hypothetical protein
MLRLTLETMPSATPYSCVTIRTASVVIRPHFAVGYFHSSALATDDWIDLAKLLASFNGITVALTGRLLSQRRERRELDREALGERP